MQNELPFKAFQNNLEKIPWKPLSISKCQNLQLLFHCITRAHLYYAIKT